MDFRVFLLAVTLASPVLTAAPIRAEAQAAHPGEPQSLAAFSHILMIDDTLDVMRAEGLKHSTDLSDSLFPDQNTAAWAALVSRIYDTRKMQARFEAALAEAVGRDAKTLAAAQEFFASDLGQRVMSLEIEARRTLLDDAAEAAAKSAWAGLVADKSARVDQITRFGRSNDLIESNVMGALNANLAFYRGLSAQGGFGDPISENQMLAEVWGQEAEIRSETTDWLYPFLALAYQPLTDAELDRYIAFSETDAGKRINSAIFVAFDAVMVRVSADLGHAAGQLMAGQDI